MWHNGAIFTSHLQVMDCQVTAIGETIRLLLTVTVRIVYKFTVLMYDTTKVQKEKCVLFPYCAKECYNSHQSALYFPLHCMSIKQTLCECATTTQGHWNHHNYPRAVIIAINNKLMATHTNVRNSIRIVI